MYDIYILINIFNYLMVMLTPYITTSESATIAYILKYFQIYLKS